MKNISKLNLPTFLNLVSISIFEAWLRKHGIIRREAIESNQTNYSTSSTFS